MNRTFRPAILLILVLILSGKTPLKAQAAGGPLPPAPDFSAGQVISSVPYPGGGYPIDAGMGQGIPIQGQIIQGAPVQGQIIGGDPFPAGIDSGSLSSAVIPFDSPILSQFGFDGGQAYGPNNPPPVADLSLRNRRDNGVVKAQEVPAPSVLLDALSRQLEEWSPQRALIDELSPATVLKMTVPYGVDTQFLCRTGSNQTTPKNGQVQVQAQTAPAYAVGILCWNLPIGLRQIFNPAQGILVPRIGFGYQQTRGELLASLAMANVSSSYEIKVGSGRKMTVRDLAVVALAFLLWKRKAIFGEGRTAAVAEVLLYAGIVGNLIDRVFRGFVIDFFDFHWKAAYHFPCFNLADTFITVAAGLLVLCSFGKRTS